MKRLLLLVSVLGGCQTVTSRPGGEAPLMTVPTYSEVQPFFMWGLAPTARFVSLKEACGDRTIEQMRATTTGLDGFLGAITFGIYTPRTAQVWCGSNKETTQN